MTEKEAYLAFSTFPSFGPQRFKLLKEYFGSAKEAWKAPKKELGKLGVKAELLEKFLNHRNNFGLEDYLGKLGRLGIEYTTHQDSDYPEKLKSLDDSPFLLYVKGKPTRGPLPGSPSAPVTRALGQLSVCAVAVVGTRKPTGYGRDVTERLVEGLVRAGVTIISGLALGIDAIAHKAALDAGGFTVGVVGGGLDDIYPPSNRGLAQKMIEKGGMVISEYPLGFPAMPQNFPVRNRIVSGMSLGVLVVEGTVKSGTLLTAAAAARQGRDVFAVPGPITSPTSAAPNLLIKNGAKLVEKAEDILEELEINVARNTALATRILPETEEERKVLRTLELEALDIDSIVRISTLEVGIVLSALTIMELKGMVKNVGGTYRKNF
ncbi:MAG: DNA-processing protein DprA [Patescibacteria group bacterium]